MDLLSSYLSDEHVRLLCLQKIGSDLLRNLLSFFVTTKKFIENKKVTSVDPNVAVSQLLKLKGSTELEIIKNESTLTNYKTFFSSLDPVKVADCIDISLLDVTALNYLLQNLSDTFPTCKDKYRRQLITCIGENHQKCCKACTHKTSKLDCTNCTVPHSTCFINSTPCCLDCKQCPNCADAFTATVCVNTKLRDSVDHIRKLRNLIAHSNHAVYNTFQHEDFPTCHNWDDLWQLCSEKVVDVLTYLRDENYCDKNRYHHVMNDVKNVIPEWKKDELIDQYDLRNYVEDFNQVLENLQEVASNLKDGSKRKCDVKKSGFRRAFDSLKYVALKINNMGIAIIVVIFVAYLVRNIANVNEKEDKSVYEGLAWSYYFGYLQIILPEFHTIFKDRKIDGIDIREKITDRRLFIIVPADGYCYPDFNQVDKRMKFLFTLPELIRTRAGVQKRVFKNSLYEINIKGNGTKYVAVEFATPVSSLYLMSKNTKTNLNQESREYQVSGFYNRLKEILDDDQQCIDKYKLILTGPGGKSSLDGQKKLADIIWNEIP